MQAQGINQIEQKVKLEAIRLCRCRVMKMVVCEKFRIGKYLLVLLYYSKVTPLFCISCTRVLK